MAAKKLPPNGPDYSFQNELIERAWDFMTKDPRKAVVLAAGCGAGKTEMAMDLIERFLKTQPAAKVLYLAHGTTSLRAQIAQRFRTDGRFTVAEMKDAKPDLAASVHVAIPQNKLIRSQQYDLVVVDEAHHYYFGAMIGEVLTANPDCTQLLLTASHWRFTRMQRLPVITFSQLELLDRNIIMPPHVGLMLTDQEFRSFTAEGNLSEDEKLENIDQLVAKIKPKIKGKTLIACHNQQAARDIAKGIKGAVVSTSDDDPNEIAFRSFLGDPKCKVMVVVFRGVIGFDLPSLETVIDLTCSQNPDRIYQLLGRCVRRHQAKQPRYVKLAPKVSREWYAHIMCGVMWLAEPGVYSKWNGTLDSIRMVVTKSSTKRTKVGGKRALPSFKAKIPTWNEIPMLLEQAEGNEDYEFVSLARVRDMANGVDPEGNKRKILAFRERTGAWPKQKRPGEEGRLGSLLANYTVLDASTYDQNFAKEVQRLGRSKKRSRDPIRRKQEVLEFLRLHNRRPKKSQNEKDLSDAFSSYFHESSRSYDPDFAAAVTSLRVPSTKGQSKFRRILCVETNEIFESGLSAARWCNGSPGGLCSAIKRKKAFKGYTFRYADDEETK
jgi:hypothetical protein